MHAAIWILFGPIAAAAVTAVAGRLLGARRGWLALAISGVVGWTAGVVVAGELTDWSWGDVVMPGVALALGTLFTMTMAVLFDLVRPVGTLSKGDAAGLVTVRNPVVAVKRSLDPVRRYREVLGIARRNGVVGRQHDSAALPAGVRRTLEQAGGLFVKLGQVASTRTDVLPRAWCEELASLRSAAQPAPESQMRPHLTAELGADPEALYARFDWTPLAAASIGQVYRAELTDGSSVVVKVQRPGLDETLARDSAAVMQLARLIERRTVLGLSIRPAELAEEFVEGVMEELDFRVEASNARDLEAALAGTTGVRVPKMYTDLSNSHVLTEEFVSAPRIGEVDQLVAAGHDPRSVADRVLESFVHQIFVAGIFHADPHPGNMLVEPDGTIVLIDLGAVGRIGPGHRSAVLQMLVAASAGDAASLRRALTSITSFDANVDLARLDGALEAFLARHLRAGGGISAKAFEDMVVLIGRYGIRLPRWFGTLCRTLVTLEGTLSTVAPGFSLVDAAKAHAGDLGPSPDDFREAIEREAMLQLPRLRLLSEHADEVLGQVAAGRLLTRVSILSDPRDERVVTKLVDRLVLGVVASALGVGSVLLLGVSSGPTLGDSISMNEVLGYFGLASSALLTLRLVAGIVRDGQF